MSLEKELGLKKGFSVLEHEAILNIYYTASRVKKAAGDFFRKFSLTDVQFNVLMLLHHQCTDSQGLSQAELSDMMLVNRANITTLIDRMEKGGLVERTASSTDRRYNIVRMTSKGRKLFARVEPLYAEVITRVMSPLKESEKKKLIAVLERIRGSLDQ
jgi:DNA-binding MarR family transcriptional regulator